MRADPRWGWAIAPAVLGAALLLAGRGKPESGPALVETPRASSRGAEGATPLGEARGPGGEEVTAAPPPVLRGSGLRTGAAREGDPRDARIQAAYDAYRAGENAPARAAAIEAVVREGSRGARMLWAREAVRPELTEAQRRALRWDLAESRGGPDALPRGTSSGETPSAKRSAGVPAPR